MALSVSRPVRFTVIVFFAALGTVLAAVGGWRYARASAPVSGPIILVSIDTLRADHLPAYGYKKVATPALDALAADGVVFERAYSHAPHTPYAPPERFAELDPYDGEIAYADEIVGRLVRYLKSHQLYDRSTVIVLSDHGEGLGDHGEQEHGLFVYDEAIHVPLIVKQESNVGAGRRVAAVVQHIDVVPTILELVKAPGSGSFRGRSLKPLLDGTGTLPELSVYSEAL